LAWFERFVAHAAELADVSETFHCEYIERAPVRGNVPRSAILGIKEKMPWPT